MSLPNGIHGWPEDGQNTRGFPVYSSRQQYRLGQVVRGGDMKLYQAAVEYPTSDPTAGVGTDWQSFPPRRRTFVPFQSPSVTFSASDDLSQVWEMPFAENNASVIWVPARMILYCAGVASGPKTSSVQLKQNNAPGNSGSPTNLTNLLSLTASAQASSITTSFPAGVTIPSGNFVYANWTYDTNMSGVWVKIEFEAQDSSS